MKPASAIKTILCLVGFSAGPALAGPEFFLFHAPTETVLGPYEFETGQKLGSPSQPWKLAVASPTTFTLTGSDGEPTGPFTFAEHASVKVGPAEFALSTNAEAMLRKRVDQKMWKQYPETNPKFLSVLRGTPVDSHKFIRAEPDAVFVSNPKGITRILLSLLPEDIQQKYAYDAAKADAYSKEQALAHAEWRKKKLDEATSKADAQQQLWESLQPVATAQPEFPEAHFKTKGALGPGTSTPVGGSGYGGLHFKNDNSQNQRNQRN